MAYGASRRPVVVVRVAFLLGGVLFVSGCSVDDSFPEGSDVFSEESAVVEPTAGELTPVLPSPPTSQPTASTSTTHTQSSSTTTTAATLPTVALDRVDLGLELVATLSSPIGLASRAGSDDLFVIEQAGRIVRLPGGEGEGADTTLDIRGQVSTANEQGLLGLAFSPDGSTLFINMTDRRGDTVISRFVMVDSVANVESEEVLLTIPQPRANHNGGQLAFGPDGYLYIGMGDGGGGGDPGDHGQNPNTLLGSILRIEVDTAEGYGIPSDNPFSKGEAPEVFIWGVRNAWRFGFDSATGDLWIGDVGQDRFEEVTVLRAADGGGNGANLGWNEAEGTESYRGGTIPDGHVAPVITYGHASNRCSITGGEVYRGGGIPGLAGSYIYGDFCTGEIFGYRVDESAEPSRLDLRAVDRLSSFGLDAAGEIYVLSGSGGIFRIVSA